MADKKSRKERIDELEARLERIERHHEFCHDGDDGSDAMSEVRCCSVPEVAERTFDADVSQARAEAIRTISKKWVNGTVLRYYFFTSRLDGGTDAEQQVVHDAFKVWEDVGIGIRFQETTDIEEAEVRIGFRNGDGSWSYLGRDVIDIPGQHERTMNFGWDITRPGEIDTAIHEIGHTLGLNHEHQNPNAGIAWDEEAVYTYFAGSPNFWSRQKTFHNVLRKLDRREVEGSNWDRNSIMHYQFRAGLINEPREFRTRPLIPAAGLSETDQETVRGFYPPEPDNRLPELKPFELKHLEIEAGEQKNFLVSPGSSRYYTFTTIGSTDTVMVLFEDDDGELRYVRGDDDSGTGRNARFRVRLRRNRDYVLRIRLYYSFASGGTAVVMW